MNVVLSAGSQTESVAGVLNKSGFPVLLQYSKAVNLIDEIEEESGKFQTVDLIIVFSTAVPEDRAEEIMLILADMMIAYDIGASLIYFTKDLQFPEIPGHHVIKKESISLSDVTKYLNELKEDKPAEIVPEKPDKNKNKNTGKPAKTEPNKVEPVKVVPVKVEPEPEPEPEIEAEQEEEVEEIEPEEREYESNENDTNTEVEDDEQEESEVELEHAIPHIPDVSKPKPDKKPLFGGLASSISQVAKNKKGNDNSDGSINTPGKPKKDRLVTNNAFDIVQKASKVAHRKVKSVEMFAGLPWRTLPADYAWHHAQQLAKAGNKVLLIDFGWKIDRVAYLTGAKFSDNMILECLSNPDAVFASSPVCNGVNVIGLVYGDDYHKILRNVTITDEMISNFIGTNKLRFDAVVISADFDFVSRHSVLHYIYDTIYLSIEDSEYEANVVFNNYISEWVTNNQYSLLSNIYLHSDFKHSSIAKFFKQIGITLESR